VQHQGNMPRPAAKRGRREGRQQIRAEISHRRLHLGRGEQISSCDMIVDWLIILVGRLFVFWD